MLLYSILFLMLGFVGLYVGAKFLVIGLEDIAHYPLLLSFSFKLVSATDHAFSK